MQFVLFSLGLFTSVSASSMKPGPGAAHAVPAPQDNNCFALSSGACSQKKEEGIKKVFHPRQVVFGFPGRNKTEDLDGGGEKETMLKADDTADNAYQAKKRRGRKKQGCSRTICVKQRPSSQKGSGL